MRYEVIYTYSVPKKKPPYGLIIFGFVIFLAIVDANDKSKKTPPSPSSPTVGSTQLPVSTLESPPAEEPVSLSPPRTTRKGAKPSAADYRAPYYVDSNHLH